MSGFGRQLPVNIAIVELIERPLTVRADIYNRSPARRKRMLEIQA